MTVVRLKAFIDFHFFLEVLLRVPNQFVLYYAMSRWLCLGRSRMLYTFQLHLKYAAKDAVILNSIVPGIPVFEINCYNYYTIIYLLL
jgi:hypothetical protein